MSDETQPMPWRFAPLWKRLAAKCFDFVLFLLLFSPAVDYGVRQAFSTKNIGPFAMATFLYPLAEILLVRLFQGTPGKRMLGLRVIRLDGGRLGWTDSLHRQWVLLILMTSQSLQISALLPALPPEFDLATLAQAVQDGPSRWAILSDLATALLLASNLLVLFRFDRRSFQDLMAGSVVVQAAPPPPSKG